MSVPVFPKIPAYRREADVLHAVRRVVCLEKLDGSNTRVWVPREGEVVFGGRTLLEGEPGFCQPELREAVEAAVLSRARALAQEHGADLLLFGETCGRGIQSQGFVYGPRPHLVLFAAQLGPAWLSLSARLGALPSLREVADQLGLPLAPTLYEGPPDEARFDALIEQPSTYARRAGAPQEGIVIWSDPLLLDGAGVPLVAKHKDPRRSEALEREDTGLEGLATFAERVVQVERLRHARQHLQETGRWRGVWGEQVRLLQQRVVQDVAREVPEYQDQLRARGKQALRETLAQRVLQVLPALEADDQ